ncbi:efflux RND transporter permease subunit [Pseudoalteromonas sp. NBT06-2]|uniref:efflux RND transporter permease subunit n=1 Tax=Pseudoalteromonas sp. NBT06-2 TaxID=2025950 RepID=UPI0014829BD9|nr:efflux RND transporter permease subunit [Pseudoalteromonas sp. NBT06-2]
MIVDQKNKKFGLPINLWLTSLALKRPVTTVMVMLSLFVTGLVASRLLPQESWPSVTVPVVFIYVPYSGSSPKEVERLITRPIEEAIATVGGISSMKSRSRANSSGIQIMMDLGSDLDSKILEIREKVDMISHLLPDDVQKVNVQKFSTDDFPIMTLTISGEKDLSHAYDFLNKKLVRKIERLIGVGKIELRGVVKPNIEIKLDSTKLAMNRVNQGQLLKNLRESNFIVRSASILNGERKFSVTSQGEYKSLADINNFQVKANIKLSDVAQVSLKSPEKDSEIRSDRQKTIGLEIFKESDANVVDVANNVVNFVDIIAADPEFKHIKIKVKNNSGNEIQESLSDLLKAGFVGIVLSFSVLYIFFRNYRVTLAVVASVPVSLSFAIAGMYFMGYTLNMLTLAGLFIAVGLLIDNSVVICESILQQQSNGLTHYQKVIKGVDNVSIAVICGTLTTVIIFLPILMGEKNFITVLIEQIAVAICLPLLASLLVAKTLIPLMLSKVTQNELAQVTTQSWIDAFYRPSLKKILLNPKYSALGVLLLCLLGFFARDFVSNQQEHSKKSKDITIRYHVISGQKLADVSQLVDQMEAYLYDNQEEFGFKKVDSRIYADYASSRIKLNKHLPMPISELKEKIRAGFPKTAIAKPSFAWSDNKEMFASISLLGSSTERLMSLSESVILRLKQIEGFDEVGIDDTDKKLELLLRIDNEKVARLGLNTQDIANRISTALRGVNLRSFRDEAVGEIEMRLVYHDKKALPLSQIKDLPIYETQGRILTLQQLVTFDSQPVLPIIHRVQRQTSLTISINLNDITRTKAAEKIKVAMKGIALPTGYEWQLGKAYRNDDISMANMTINMLLALALIFMVMAALFESLLMPIAILSSIALAFIGVYFTFTIMNMGLGETAMIGMLILMGIVVNNGIVLIDQINKLKGSSTSLTEPIIDACATRIRPILMTVATTIIGLVPVAIASSNNEAYPLAIAIIGGLIFSTFTSLFLVPYCYLMLVKLGERSAKRFTLAKKFADKYIET